MDWSSIFDESIPAPGASDAEIERFVATIGKSLSVAEVAEVNRGQHNPFPASAPFHASYRPFDPSGWVIPTGPLPPDYLSFLRWSNGGWCRTGDREFGFFPTDHPTGGIRQMMLAYRFPEYMPGALPFALNGGGTFYLFDMREPARGGNYPVVCTRGGSMGWGPVGPAGDAKNVDGFWFVADSFEAACRGSINVDDLRETEARPEFDATERVAIYLEHPLKSLKTLLIIKEHLGITTSIAELKRMAQSIPCCISDALTHGQAVNCCAKVNAIEECLGIRSLRDQSICLPLNWRT